MKKILIVGGLIALGAFAGALGAFAGGPVVSAVQHSFAGPSCTLRWSGSTAYMTMSGSDARAACQAALGLSGDLVLVDGAPSLPVSCRHTVYGQTTVTVRAQAGDAAAAQLCNGE